MGQIFSPAANSFVRGAIAAGFTLGLSATIALMVWHRSPSSTGVGRAMEQPVPFSHQHHVNGLAIDCRYCHRSVETSSFAGIPSSDTCMNCHLQIWTTAPMLEPVRESWRTGRRIRWQRVHNLPDFVYFDHSVHVRNGVGCVTCHGRVDLMPLTAKGEPLHMSFCLDCHRDPGPQLRPPEAIFAMDWQPPENRAALGRELMEHYQIEPRGLTNCTACHR